MLIGYVRDNSLLAFGGNLNLVDAEAGLQPVGEEDVAPPLLPLVEIEILLMVLFRGGGVQQVKGMLGMFAILVPVGAIDGNGFRGVGGNLGGIGAIGRAHLNRLDIEPMAFIDVLAALVEHLPIPLMDELGTYGGTQIKGVHVEIEYPYRM